MARADGSYCEVCGADAGKPHHDPCVANTTRLQTIEYSTTERKYLCDECREGLAALRADQQQQTKKCKDCHADVPELEVFPGPRCLACHAREFDKKPLCQHARPDFTKAINLGRKRSRRAI